MNRGPKPGLHTPDELLFYQQRYKFPDREVNLANDRPAVIKLEIIRLVIYQF